jgi:hypothetical protein
MGPEIVVLAVAATIVVIVGLEMLAAVLPLLIVVLFVPHCERAALAELLAAADSSPKLRLWPAVHAAAVARRRRRRSGDRSASM